MLNRPHGRTSLSKCGVLASRSLRFWYQKPMVRTLFLSSGIECPLSLLHVHAALGVLVEQRCLASPGAIKMLGGSCIEIPEGCVKSLSVGCLSKHASNQTNEGLERWTLAALTET